MVLVQLVAESAEHRENRGRGLVVGRCHCDGGLGAGAVVAQWFSFPGAFGAGHMIEWRGREETDVQSRRRLES